jgi:hypothetical protein
MISKIIELFNFLALSTSKIIKEKLNPIDDEIVIKQSHHQKLEKYNEALQLKLDEQKENTQQEMQMQRFLSEQEEQKKKEKLFWIENTGLSSSAKYYLYSSDFFDEFQSQKIYKDIVINNLLLHEPFYTIFTKLLIYWDKNNEWIKSNKTKTIIIKVNYQTNEAFKVFVKRDLVFQTLVLSFQYLINNKIKKNDICNILLGIIIFYIDNNEEKEIFIEQCNNPVVINNIISDIENKVDRYSFVDNFFESSKKYVTEYPFVDNNYKLLPYQNIDIKNLKKLLPLNNF